ncbi:MAG: NAD-dependent DNA ligase LigA [Clostridia bacterium]
MNKKQRLEELTAIVSKLAYDYYVLDNPSVADAEYDKLSDELIALEKELGTILPDSPTNRVGGEVLEGFEKVIHEYPLQSLAKCQSLSELQSWVDGVKSKINKAEFALEYKFDGLSLSLTYIDGNLKLAATRGNGIIGENVTNQIKTIKSVPLKIPFKGKLIVVGEGLMLLSNLKDYNKNNNEPLKNARNAAAGAIRNLDPKETAKRNLDFFAYNIPFCDSEKFETQEEMKIFLKINNFLVGNFFEKLTKFSEMEKTIKQIGENRTNINILIDGVVLKLNQIAFRDELGKTSKFPKWAMAYKFEAEELSTVLKSVFWSVGRTGKVTPIAEIEPVELSGATIQKATLNNIDDIMRKQVKIGGRVFVRRSNEVIPEILGVAGDKNIGTVPIEPENCPSCGAKLVHDGVNLFCKNFDNCPSQIVGRFTHFTSRDAMNIEGVSEQTALALFEKLGLKNCSELYNLTIDDLLKLDGFKQKKAQNIINSIEKSKNPYLYNFIYALGISEIGVKASKDLAKRFGTLNNLMNATFEDLLALNNFGEVMAKEISDYFAEPKFSLEINNLIDCGIKIKENYISSNQILLGQKIVLTGTLENYSREEATKIIEKAGGEVVSSVSTKTSFVLVGENAGNKLQKAKELGIKIISETEFMNMINS